MVGLNEIYPPLTVVSVAFMQDTSGKKEALFGKSVLREIFIFKEPEDEFGPIVVVHTYTSGNKVMFFSLEGPDEGRFNFAMDISPLVKIDKGDILYTIKCLCDNTDFDKLHQDNLEAGRVRINLDPHQIN